ncbi:hypothetical protein BHM03_00056171 [Ensete ventricosum]|nr:hypothetical protein BHM03_00056171 [Ensete ventricosum]
MGRLRQNMFGARNLAYDLYNLPSEVLMDWVAKSVVLMALIDRVHDVNRVIISLGDKVDGLRKEVQRLKDGGNFEAVAMTEQQASEAQSLADHMKDELEEATLRWESMEEELGEIQKRLFDSWDQLSELVSARFPAWYPNLEVKKDPFKELPEDVNVPMATKQPFDDSLPPPEQ